MITFSSAAGSPDKENEDWVGATANAIVVLDGLSAPEGVGGCWHGTPWYVGKLGPRILMHASDPEIDLPNALATAIQEVADSHSSTCVLSDPATPSSTVAIARRRGENLDALVLADSSVIVATDDNVDLLSDVRVDTSVPDEQQAALTAPAGPERERRVAELVRAQQRVRNRAGGYWVAQADPNVAQQALTRTWTWSSVRRVAVLTDGATRPADTFDALTWSGLLDLLSSQGPQVLITETRRLEAADPAGIKWPRYKGRDDATAAFWSVRP